MSDFALASIWRAELPSLFTVPCQATSNLVWLTSGWRLHRLPQASNRSKVDKLLAWMESTSCTLEPLLPRSHGHFWVTAHCRYVAREPRQCVSSARSRAASRARALLRESQLHRLDDSQLTSSYGFLLFLSRHQSATHDDYGDASHSYRHDSSRCSLYESLN